jgi:predicted small lipoprotein YifL
MFLVYHAQRDGKLLQRRSAIMRIESKALLALLGCLLFVAACGQKGPLYLPGRSSTFESMTPGQQPAPEEESEENNEEQTDNIN